MSNIEFFIHEVKIEADTALVTGIVNKGSVPVGAIFTSVKQEASGRCDIRFLVKRIITYRREINELPAGMSGELTLEGQGAELLRKHDMLEG